MEKRTNEKRIRDITNIILIALLLISAGFVLKAWLGGNFSSVKAFREYLKRYGGLGPFVLAMIQMLQVILPVLPGFLGCIAGAAIFGAAGGFWVNYIGISAGSLIAYWLARRYGTRLVCEMIPMEKYARWVEWVNRRKYYSAILFLAILLPLAPDDFLCYFSGLTLMPARKFTFIILLAKPWCILFYSLLFAYLF